ncbi:MAG: adenosylcobinamide-GDP ribazoletransferase [Anaerolineae bacterium]|nr:adenosylcobinamide-GDP ribazoletransferase [Anaerolineae bacterium]
MFHDLITAFAFLTILPVGRGKPSDRPPGYAFSFYPLVGLVIGAIVSLAASSHVFPADLTAFVALAIWVALTGGLHLDGFADSCDGLLATVTPERRLEIMKDPRAGSWAVMGIVLLLLGKWIALRTVTPALLLMPPIAGRWAMVLAITFPPVRKTGLAIYFREGFGRSQLIITSIFAVGVALILGLQYGWRPIIAVMIAPVLVLIVGRWAANRLGGGLTGDVYGAVCELTELVCLIVLGLIMLA